MRLTQEEHHDLVVDAVRRFAGGGMARRRIIDRVEERVRNLDAWEASDDAWSESTDPKTIGRASIDWAIADLKKQGRLEHLGRNRWGVPAQQPNREPHGKKLLLAAMQWALTHPDILTKARAIADDDARIQFIVEQYYARDTKNDGST